MALCSEHDVHAESALYDVSSSAFDGVFCHNWKTVLRTLAVLSSVVKI